MDFWLGGDDILFFSFWVAVEKKSPGDFSWLLMKVGLPCFYVDSSLDILSIMIACGYFVSRMVKVLSLSPEH